MLKYEIGSLFFVRLNAGSQILKNCIGAKIDEPDFHVKI